MCIIICTAVLSSGCCKKGSPQATSFESGVLRDFSGLAGCKWIIELDNGTKLEPVNLHEFAITPAEGLHVHLTYIVKTDMASICMAGTIVQLTSITVAP
jgi:hypothetical protein